MLARFWSTYEIFTVSPTFRVPPSRGSRPTMVLNRVDLPTPLGPITPTMPLRGREKDRPLIRERPSKPFCRFSASITTLPRRGPGGI